MTPKPDAVEREMDFEPKRAWGEDLICSRCNEIIFENGVYVKAHDKIFCHVCVLDQAKINQKQLAAATAELDALRREVEAGKRYKNLVCKTDRFEGVAADGTAWSITWRDDRWYWINRDVVSVMDDPIGALELLAALEGDHDDR